MTMFIGAAPPACVSVPPPMRGGRVNPEMPARQDAHRTAMVQFLSNSWLPVAGPRRPDALPLVSECGECADRRRNNRLLHERPLQFEWIGVLTGLRIIASFGRKCQIARATNAAHGLTRRSRSATITPT
ncbi:TPA: hypothetical protein QDA96_004141 [Burkholderia vietnamiensis]|uniref:hypothetical protein n=2 Tax=Burkholderia vietnamiensis TaxID=60552 RepID=UPI0015936DC9|nr:hypothetical protein [Burkholderia vietnamiensis]HDR9043427.1 hypothetical protein [Burkholderia vietnamiensis]HDR9147416.1 hypothetical protein [Burkholderia vietnamiensis]